MTNFILFACAMTTGWAQAHPLWPRIYTWTVLIPSLASFALLFGALLWEERHAIRWCVPFHRRERSELRQAIGLFGGMTGPGGDPLRVEWFSWALQHEAWKNATAPLPATGDLTQILPAIRDHGDWDAPVSAPREWLAEMGDAS